MMTVHEVSELTGVSIRTLQYYDRIGLLHPTSYTDSGYRLYDHAALERLQQILLFKELAFPLKSIKNMMERPDFDREKALEQQITLLELKREHLENLITLARGIKMMGMRAVDFTVFDTRKIDDYAARAKASWGSTPAYQAFEKKERSRTDEQRRALYTRLMMIFSEFGTIQDQAPDGEAAQILVEKLRNFISEHFYDCSDEVLSGLGKMYGCGGEFAKNINDAAGAGAAEFASAAIEAFCRQSDRM